MSKSSTLLTALAFTLVATSLVAAEPKSDAALARARKQAEMLDTLYKTAVVAVTQTYVKEETDVAAATAFKGLFAVMKEKGYHEARLLDATGAPYEETNAPQPGFETAAIKALKNGAATHEEVTTIDGKRVLRIATPVPVVLEKCTMCHAHYAKAKPGEVIGALSYIIPIE
ncbi:MAG: DUF3365 domain-containing protein [Planctomycetaceae bacterium]|nr:DUF3365 domain-containing protein [Planctomycetaceae bacterium]MCB9950353.1 DUF3365 domain-containing protein [Planctomycetaceae bacterium]